MPDFVADELFDLDPADFTAARDALAKRLKAGGEVAAAAEVKALRRPSVGAWAVNQVARSQPEVVERVLSAGRAIAAALDAGDRAALRSATAARRETVRAATRAALDLAGDQHRDEIADTFDAAATDDESAALVSTGHLTKGLKPTAVFAPLGDVELAPPPEEPAAPPPDAAAAAVIELPLTEQVVLALIAEGTTHGWAVARLLESDGEVGRVWTVRRPLVYRAIAQLIELGLVREAGDAPSERGPRRTLVRVTPRGKRVAARWLAEPAHHVRDLRTDLLVKLLLAERAGVDPADLISRQRAVIEPQARDLERRLVAADGFDAVLLRWRVEASDAALRFLAALE